MWRTVALACFFILGGIAALGLLVYSAFYTLVQDVEQGEKIKVYYFNNQTNSLDWEERLMPTGSPIEQVQETMAMLGELPRGNALVAVFQDNVTLEHVSLVEEEELVRLSFTRSYHRMTPLDQSMLRAVCIWTLTELPFVRQVQILVEGYVQTNVLGMEIGPQNRTSININPVISPERTATRVLRLYFPNDELEGLVLEERLETINPDSLERNIVQLLIDGSRMSGTLSPIPQETRIISVITEGGICHVNLSSHFVSRFAGSPALAQLTVYSIVNTLVDNSGNVRRVQFLIDSEQVLQFYGVADFDKGFEKWDEIIIVTEPYIDEEPTSYRENFQADGNFDE